MICGIGTMKHLRILRIVNLLAAIFLPGCTGISPAILDTVVPPTEVTTTVAAETPIGEAFKTYHNPRAGYSVEYTAEWTVSEQVGTGGLIVTTFSPMEGPGIVILVQPGDLGGGAADLPNTRCEEVPVGELTGMRCFDTINRVASTTLVANGKTFTIAPLGKYVDESLYSRIVSGFRVIQ
jgi:hypothetical protein